MVLKKKDLDEALDVAVKDLITRFTVIIDEKLTAVVTRVMELEERVADNRTQLETQATKMEELCLANEELRLHIDSLSEKIEQFESENSKFSSSDIINKITEVEERLESRTNRQLRQTLVFKGVRETEDESWDDTFDIIAGITSKHLGISKQKALSMFNRVHRGRPAKNDNNSPRAIYANLFKWYDCEELVDCFKKLNIENKSSVRVSYHYGPRTSYRRNLALVERKRLKDSGVITSGYLEFPAKLFGKSRGSDKYKLVKDFSKEEVVFKK